MMMIEMKFQCISTKNNDKLIKHYHHVNIRKHQHLNHYSVANIMITVIIIMMVVCMTVRSQQFDDEQQHQQQQQMLMKLQSNDQLQQQQQLLSPQFIDEPPSKIIFSNSTGTVLSCTAKSSISSVKIWWINVDNQAAIVQEIAGLRYVRPNGQLVFPPFTMDQYRQDIHSTTYRCMASNSFSTIRSRDCQLRAVIHQTFKLQVYDEFVIKENIAIMRCHVPMIVRDFIRIIAWLRDDHVLVTSAHNSHTIGRYQLLSTGELLIYNTTFQDSGYYRCQIRNQLTDELQISQESGRLIVTEPHNGIAPRIWTHPTISCDLNSICELICVAQSWPLSSYRWYRETETGVYMAANLYDVDVDISNDHHHHNNRLIFRPTKSSHNGKWICVANNSLAEEKIAIQVQVRSPLQVIIEPRQAQVDAGRSITFNCTAIGGPPSRQPSWYFNGKNMIQIFREHIRDQRIRLIESNILHISSVRRQDVGAYQCVIQSEQEESQAIVELKLGDVAPMLLETFPDRQITDVNNAISIRCSVIGTPLPQIRWFLDGQPIPPNLSRFRTGDHVTNDGKVVSYVNITNIRVIDGGKYTCLAENEVGRVSFDGLVLVNGGPSLRTSTFWGVQQQQQLKQHNNNNHNHHNISVVANMNIQLYCPLIGYPLESIQWEHNNNILPVNHRQSIEPIIDGYGGILHIESVHSFQDSGDYSCTIRLANHNNNVGDTLTTTTTTKIQSGNNRSNQQQQQSLMKGNIQLNVHYAPKIDRHSLPEFIKTKQGDRIKLMCSIIEGDQPIIIEWFRATNNGGGGGVVGGGAGGINHHLMNRLVRSNELISIQNGDDYSLLTFKNVAITDSDKWTCRARNAYASDNATVEIIVNVPPKWIHEPKNFQVILGRSLMVDCQADGYPKPKIIWKKAITSSAFNTNNNDLINDQKSSQQQQYKSNDFHDIISSYRYQIFANGSLFIQESELIDNGIYMCQISNGIGTDLSKVIQIHIQQPPRVEQKFVTEIVIKGQTTSLQCRSDGDPILKSEWKRDMQAIPATPQQSSNQHYIIKEEQQQTLAPSQSKNQLISYLEIIDTARIDSALFTCTITNPYGSDVCNIQLIVQEVPEPPRDIIVTDITSRTVKIKWKPSFAGNSAIIGFLVQYRSKCFRIDHKLNMIDNSNSNNNLDENIWKELYINDVNLQTFQLNELYPFCKYDLQMKAQNSIGLSDSSQIVTFKTAEEMPGGPPLDVSVEPLSSNSLKIKWRPPDFFLQYGQIKGYYIGYRIVSSLSNNNNKHNNRIDTNDEQQQQQYAYKNVEATLTESTINNGGYEIAYLTNLKKYTLYSIVVQAFNAAGAGPRSDEITVRTLNIQKSNPIVLEILNTDIDSITIRWEIDTVAEEDYFSPSTISPSAPNENDFLLHISEEGSGGKWIEKRLPRQLRRHVETNLKCGTKYYFYMTYASSPLKHSAETGEIVSARTKGTVAISPSLDEFITVNDTAIMMNLDSWHDGGCSIQNFTIKYRKNHQKHWKNIGTIRYDHNNSNKHHRSSNPSSIFAINNLEPDQFYILSVIAASAAGLTEAIYNVSTMNTSSSSSSSTMIFRLSPPDLASYEYQVPNAPFHNVTIMLPIIISVIVLIAVLTTLIAFMRKQELLRHERECGISQSSQNLHLRSSSIRSKDDITLNNASEMIAAYPMVDYHTICSTPKSNPNKMIEPIQQASNLDSAQNSNHIQHQQQITFDDIYNKSLMHQHYSPNSKHTSLLCSDTAARSPHVSINSGGNHHIYAEPNGALIAHQIQSNQSSTLSSTYAQPRLIMGAATTADTLIQHASNQSQQSLINHKQQPPTTSSSTEKSSLIMLASTTHNNAPSNNMNDNNLLQNCTNHQTIMNDKHFDCALMNLHTTNTHL